MKTKPRLLLVDDEPCNLELLRLALQDEYDIVSVTDSCDVIDKIEGFLPDLIILDIMMPEFSGFDVCRMIRENKAHADIPILFLTALGTVDTEMIGLELGAVDYLTKPVNLKLLKLRVRNHVESKKRNDLVKEQRDQLEAGLKRIKEQNHQLEMAMSQIHQLEGILPICMYCKKIKDDNDFWQQLEHYISKHSEAEFSHGICPDCYEHKMREMDLKDGIRNGFICTVCGYIHEADMSPSECPQCSAPGTLDTR